MRPVSPSPKAARADTRRRGDDGFTLFEALVALVLISLATAILAHGLSNGIASTRRADLGDAALAVARNTLTGLGHSLPLAEGRQSGRADGGLVWTLDIVRSGSTDDPDVVPEAYWATVRVSASGGPVVELTTVKLAWPRRNGGARNG